MKYEVKMVEKDGDLFVDLFEMDICEHPKKINTKLRAIARSYMRRDQHIASVSFTQGKTTKTFIRTARSPEEIKAGKPCTSVM